MSLREPCTDYIHIIPLVQGSQEFVIPNHFRFLNHTDHRMGVSTPQISKVKGHVVFGSVSQTPEEGFV